MPIDNVVDELSEMTLRGALLNVADPLKENFPGGVMPDEIKDEVNEILMQKFNDVENALFLLIHDCVGSISDTRHFKSVSISNSYDILTTLMTSLPNKLELKLNL